MARSPARCGSNAAKIRSTWSCGFPSVIRRSSFRFPSNNKNKKQSRLTAPPLCPQGGGVFCNSFETSRFANLAFSRCKPGAILSRMSLSAADDAQFQRASDQSLLICFGQEITLDAHERVRKLLRLLESEPVPGIRNLHPAYCSVLVKFDALKWRHEELEQLLGKYLHRLQDVTLPETRQVEIPVCYGGEHGPDLEEVGALHAMTPQQVIDLHSSTTYFVYFLGFVPCFAYL